MASQRARGGVIESSEYKYRGLKDEGIRPHEQCEMQEDDTHEVHPTSWPPPRIGNIGGDPSVTLRCVHCGAWVITYAGHATGQMKGVRVVLPEPAAEAEPPRRGPGRPPKVA